MKNVISFVLLEDVLKQKLNQQFNTIIYNQLEIKDYSSIADELAKAHGLLVSPLGFNPQILELANSLEVLSTASVGYNHFPIDTMLKQGIIGTHTPYVLDDTVADTVMGLILMTTRRLAELYAYTKAGKWKQTITKEHFGLDVHHKKLGIIGLGRIGQTIAKRAKLGFDMDVSYFDIQRNEATELRLGIELESIESLLKSSDIIVMMMPYTAETKNFMDLDKLKLMKPTAVLINAARGQVVNEADLLVAIDQGIIYGAGLDVFVEEPLPIDHPFLKRDKIVTLPHIGSAVSATRYAMTELAVDNLIKALSGEKPKGLIRDFNHLF